VRREPDLISAHHVFCLALFRLSLTNSLPGGLFAGCHLLFVLIFLQVARAV